MPAVCDDLPLPSGTYYAIARTWLDKDAPRSGCVLTRTALVAMVDWQLGSVSLSDVLNSLRYPAAMTQVRSSAH
ncbi:hypothetical protein ACQ5SK_18535 [Bradyrhizobium japonicum]